MSRNIRILVAAACLCGCLVFWTTVYVFRPSPGYPKEAVAQLQIETIDHAARDYKNAHGDYPPSLIELIVSENGEVPLLERSDLIDPWGRPFRYDPSDRHPRSGMPRITTVSPKRFEICNWHHAGE